MKILLSHQIKSAEENAVSRGIVSYAQLMKSAGDAATNEILNRYFVNEKKVCVVCGSGNNGGDGLVIAANLKKHGADVCLLTPLGFPKTDTALEFKDDVKNIPILDDFTGEFDFVIDALFGIGLDRLLSEKIVALVNKINSYPCIKIAIDVPSGVFCDGGEVATAFCADLTLTFSCYKTCQLLPQTGKYCGETVVLDIGLPLEEYAYLTIEKPQIVERSKYSHKGTFGTALFLCGSYGMCGASILATRAALRSGVGIAKVVVCDKNYSAFTGSVPEAVTIPVPTFTNGAPQVFERTLITCLSTSNAVLIGCGLGCSVEAKNLVYSTLINSQIPIVVDADGINALQGGIDIIRKIKAPVILTPHPAEMARICNTTTQKIELNRVKYARGFAIDNKCYIVLKGTNTIVATPKGEVFFNTTGNNGLATGGSGDVLAGMIVSRLAQGYEPINAILNSVWIHGAVADEIAKTTSTRAILPSDIIEGLKTISD